MFLGNETMNTAVGWAYFDPDFDGLSERIHGPICKVTIDNEIAEECTVIMIDTVKKQGLLMEAVQVLTDMNLNILKGYISSDAEWSMDVFHVKDGSGNKITDQNVINYIHRAIEASNKIKAKFLGPNGQQSRAIELTGRDRPGLFSEISAALADLHINIVEAHAWTHNARLACVAYISDQRAAIDNRRLAAIEHHLAAVLRATTSRNTAVEDSCTINHHQLRDGNMTDVERRLHQLMLSVRDFDAPPRDRRQVVSVDRCDERGYSIVTVSCKDRRRLMFDTVCTLTDMQYVIFHASVNARDGYAFQEYFIRHVDGCAVSTDGEMERVKKCLEAAIERRVCEGVRLELCATNRVGLLSDITRVLRESGLVVARADVATEGEKSVNAFYVRDMSGKNVDMEFIKSVPREIGPIIDLAVKYETCNSPPNPT